jgi:nucleotide-binding universal stress UspA family protein
MTTRTLRTRPHATTTVERARPELGVPHGDPRPGRAPKGRPIVAGIGESEESLGAAREAARLSAELGAPLILVYVRGRPWAGLGVPYHQRRLNAELARAQRALDSATSTARDEGVAADGEILEGDPAQRVVEFARHRDARMVVLGSRRRRFGKSVSRRVIHDADRSVVVAGARR